ncbi:MAG: hypothetical protein HUJ51_05600 [Eggerthellaceae bacterium]|nr:hypothetical protein [Eggerthellaceae bacterium]
MEDDVTGRPVLLYGGDFDNRVSDCKFSCDGNVCLKGFDGADFHYILSYMTGGSVSFFL